MVVGYRLTFAAYGFWLPYDPVHFSAEQINCVARGFARAVAESKYFLHARSIMPDPVSLVARRYDKRAEQIIGHFKTRTTQQLLAANLHPSADRRDEAGKLQPAWAGRGRKVFLGTVEDIDRSVVYGEKNPLKHALPRQVWPFVSAVE